MTTSLLERLFGISGKIAVVTDKGCNSSIDIAPVLAEAGARVVVADHSAAHMQSVVDKIVSAGGEAIAIEADVEREALRDCVVQSGQRSLG
ncbi:NADP-dependent 3-hydroxy acid dehydrogenase YdfG [Paraburkholderia sp. HC6.4b]|uniref:SDR family NAD(P)-dependent oxidoreductase n=1 Tax=unclassified Paraburkholderia TaxID=2615204 RepID=UPI00179A83B9|nr:MULTISPECIES: SDR family NAD(P)-dependent oxidoreductase [unclassified Paraburkholderia]MBB5410370.1 NADP-dependent 3-hydroxy acid dehydrogenase YdfG [Paraburkholderia sp. HC6.4b]MBB5452579.1 NADP-dependent 3-hydroxy acid dehydrogenase YdfG [Paraburkholderia sp. Kb1A]